MEGAATSYLDNDIMQVLSKISFTKEKLLLLKSENARLEKLLEYQNVEMFKLQDSLKSHTDSLESNKNLLAEQQITISKLMGVKDEIKKSKDTINLREQKILEKEKEKFNLIKEHELKVEELKKEFNQQIHKMKNEAMELRNELNITKSEGLRKSVKAQEDLKQALFEKDQMANKLVLNYEEQIQRLFAQIHAMKDEITANKATIYKLEQKLNQRVNVVRPNNMTRTNDPGPTRSLKEEAFSQSKNVAQNQGERPRSTSVSSVVFSSPKTMKTFQLTVNQKYTSLIRNPSTSSSYNTGEPKVYSEDENKGFKKQAVKRKLFNKFSEEFAEIGDQSD